jgi:hypothetical protein
VTAYRLLAWADDALPEPPEQRLEPLRHLLLVAAALDVGLTNRFEAPSSHPLALLLPLGLAACAALAVPRAARQAVTAAAAVLMLAVSVWRLPHTPNHYLLVTAALFLLALLDARDPAESRLCLQALRWLILIVIGVSGLQKLSYGTYFRGEFLAYAIAHNDYFGAPFAALLPPGELARLRGLVDGPFLADAPALVAASNLTWVFEIAAVPLLLWPATRPAALAATLTFFVFVEAAARELMFGSVAVGLLLLFGRRNWNRLLLPAFLVLFAVLILVRFGGLPEFFFT